MALFSPALGAVADYAVGKKLISQLNLQRVCMCIGNLIPAAGFIGLTYLTSESKQGWKFMSCSRCQEFGQQASWLLIGYTRATNRSEARPTS